MSPSVKLVTDKLDVKLRLNKIGNELSIVIGVHFDAKKSLKSLAFFLKSVTNLLPTFSGGTRGICFFFYKCFLDRPKYLRACSCINQLLS